MKKPIFLLISLFIAIPCFAQAQADNAANSPEDDCFPQSHEDYQEWVRVGKPACWCYHRQCYGDINGSSFLGKPVTGADLLIFKAAFNQAELPEGGICADLNHASFFGKRVTGADLVIFKEYFYLPEEQVPDCFPPYIPYQ